MAAALLRHSAGNRVRAASAGTHPKPLHPAAAAVLRDRYRIDISGHRPTHVSTVAGQRFDYVISLCDKAREACPEFAAPPAASTGACPIPRTRTPPYAGFERVAAELSTRIRFRLPVLA